MEGHLTDGNAAAAHADPLRPAASPPTDAPSVAKRGLGQSPAGASFAPQLQKECCSDSIPQCSGDHGRVPTPRADGTVSVLLDNHQSEKEDELPSRAPESQSGVALSKLNSLRLFARAPIHAEPKPDKGKDKLKPSSASLSNPPSAAHVRSREDGGRKAAAKADGQRRKQQSTEKRSEALGGTGADPAVWSNSCVGRLDAGSIEITLVSARVRSEQKIGHKELTADEILQSFDHTKPQYLDGPRLSLYVCMQYAVVSDALLTLLEDEPNTSVQARMQEGIVSVIKETLFEHDLFSGSQNPIPRVLPELARQKCSAIPFEESTRVPRIPESELEAAYNKGLLDIEFVQPASSETLEDLAPYLSHSIPAEVGEPKEFKHIFLTYEADWSAPRRSSSLSSARKSEGCEDAGAFFKTRALQSTERVPILIAKVYQRVRETVDQATPWEASANFKSQDVESSKLSGETDRLVGLCCLETADLVDFQRPFNRIWAPLHTALRYDILPANSENAKPVASFNTVWRVTQYLSERRVPEREILKAIAQSIEDQGGYRRVNEDWAVQISQGLPYTGEAFFLTKFCPSDPNLDAFGGASAETCMTVEFESRTNRTDMCGGPLVPIVYDPNVPLVRRKWPARSVGTVEKLILNKDEFERLDYEDIRRKEAYTNLLDRFSLWKWKYFLSEVVCGSQKDSAVDQWMEIEKALHVRGKAVDVSHSNWSNTVNLLCGEELPRFLVEVWCGEEFCGETLLPKLMDIKEMHQTRNLFRLYPSSASLSRPDRRKNLATHRIRGWIHMRAAWRILHPRAGRFNLQVRELRDITTRSRNENELQPGSPQVKVFMYDQRTGKWTEAATFTPFEHGLYFLGSGQAQRSMVSHWGWQEEIMGEPEPDWMNYFSWAEPGKFVVEEREVPVPLNAEYRVGHKLDLLHLEPETMDANLKISRLCKNGIPEIMRPYAWTQLSGAVGLKQVLDSKLEQLLPAHAETYGSAYAYLRRVAHSSKLSCDDQIEDDALELRLLCGIPHSMVEDIKEVLRTLMAFSAVEGPLGYVAAAAGLGTTVDEARLSLEGPVKGKFASVFNCESYSTNVGVPLAYTRSLMRLTYHLMLDHQSLRLTNEEVFYVVYALCGAGSKASAVPPAPFLGYHALHPFATKQKNRARLTFADDIPHIERDILFIRAALELLHPKKAEALKVAGICLEDLLFAPLNNLFAGALPSQSLFRLWDMIFNVVLNPSQLIESDYTYSHLQRKQQEELVKRGGYFGMCCAPAVGDELIVGGDVSRNVHEAFQKSHGRRVLVAFTYALLSTVFNDLLDSPAPAEIRNAFSAYLASIRDPSEVVRLVERGDFVLFTSEVHFRYAKELCESYIKVKHDQLKAHREQNKLLQEIVQPWHVILRHSAPTQIAVTTDHSSPERFTARCLGHGLSTKDLREHLYPCVKYQCLYAPPQIRCLPLGVLGRVIIKVDEIDLFGTSVTCFPEVTVSFGKLEKKQRSSVRMNGNTFVWRNHCLFVFPITAAPPYKVKITVQGEGGKVLASLRKGFLIRKLICQGETFRLFAQEELSSCSSQCTLNVSWYMYTPTGQMFLPPVDGKEVLMLKRLQFGEGLWGDLGSFYPMHAEVSVERLARLMRMELDPFSSTKDAKAALIAKELSTPTHKLARTTYHGLPKPLLDELFFYSFPALLPYTEAIVRNFGQVEDKTNFQEILNAEVGLRDFISGLVIASQGTVLDKASILFDLYGHYEEDRGRIGNYHLFYNAPPYLPLAERGKEVKVGGNRLTKELVILDKFLPDYAMPVILNDKRTTVNCISLNEAVALVRAILLRSCIHLDNMQAFQLASSLFDPERRIPRLLGAVLLTNDLQEGRTSELGHTNGNTTLTWNFWKNYLMNRRSKGLTASSPTGVVNAAPASRSTEDARRGSSRSDSSGQGSFSSKFGTPTNEAAGNVHTSNGEVVHDVTLALLTHMMRLAGDTALFGLNFTIFKSLRAININDPFPGCAKTLRIALAPDGSYNKIDFVSIDVDKDGEFLSGSGGNARFYPADEDLPTHLRKTGIFSLRRLDIRPDSLLVNGSYLFDLTQTLLDKTLFISRLLESDLLTEPLRRATSFDRRRFEGPLLKMRCHLNLGFEPSKAQAGVKPLSFVKPAVTTHVKAPAKHGRDRKSLKEKGGVSGSDAEEILTRRSSLELSAVADDTRLLSGPDRKVQEEALHTMAKPDAESAASTPRGIRMILKAGRGLFDTEFITKIDPYVQLKTREGSVKSSVKKEGGADVDWDDEVLELPCDKRDVLKIQVWDKDVLRKDLVGESEVSIRDIRKRPDTYKNFEFQLMRENGTVKAGKLLASLELLDYAPDLSPKAKKKRKEKEREAGGTPAKVTEAHENERNKMNAKERKLEESGREDRTKELGRRHEGRSRDVDAGQGSRRPSSRGVQEKLRDQGHRRSRSGDLMMSDGAADACQDETSLLPGVGNTSLTGRGSLSAGGQRIKVILRRALDLYIGNADDDDDETASTKKMQHQNVYVKIHHSGPAAKTPICRNAGPNPKWDTAYPFKYNPDDPIVSFRVFEEKSPGDDRLLGSVSYDLRDLPEGAVFDGLLQLTAPDGSAQGKLDVCILVTEPPKGDLPDRARVTVHYAKLAREIAYEALGYKRDASDPVYLSCIVSLGGEDSSGEQVATEQVPTPLAPLEGEEATARWEQAIEFDYKGEHIVTFRVVRVEGDEEESVGVCRFDLWGYIMSETPLRSGTLRLMKNRGKVTTGKIRVSFELYNTPPKPWPQCVRVKVHDGWATKKMDLIGASELYVQCVLGNIENRTKVVSARKNERAVFNSSFMLPFTGIPELIFYMWDEDVYKDDLVGSASFSLFDLMTSGNSSHSGRLDLRKDRVSNGEITVDIELCSPPPPPVPDFCKFVIHKGEKLYNADHLGDMRPYVQVKLGASQRRTSTCLATGVKARWNESVVLPYNNEAMVNIAVLDSHIVGLDDEIGSGSIDLWSLRRNTPGQLFFERIPVQLHSTEENRRSGKLYVSVDFLERPLCPPPVGMRVAVRSAADLHGMNDFLSKSDPFVKVTLGRNSDRTATAKNAGALPNFNDQELWLPYDAFGTSLSSADSSADSDLGDVRGDGSSCGPDEVRFEVFDEDAALHDLIGTATVNIWDIFRDPERTWAGEIQLKNSLQQTTEGKLSVAMKLVFPMHFGFGFGINDSNFICDDDVYIDYTRDTIGNFKQKLATAAFRASKKFTGEKQRYLEECRIDQEYDVIWRRPDGEEIYLNENKRFVDYLSEGLVCRDLVDGNLVSPPELAEEIEQLVEKLDPQNLSEVVDIIVTPKVTRSSSRKTNRRAARRELQDCASDSGTSDPELHAPPASSKGSVTAFPLALSALPPPSTLPKFDVAQTSLTLQHSSVASGRPSESFSRSPHTLLEVHPSFYVPAKNLAWVKCPAHEAQRIGSRFSITRLLNKRDDWVPAYIVQSLGTSYEVSALNFSETRAGWEDPVRSKVITLQARQVLPVMSTTSIPIANPPAPTRSSQRKMAPCVPWVPPRLSTKGFSALSTYSASPSSNTPRKSKFGSHSHLPPSAVASLYSAQSSRSTVNGGAGWTGLDEFDSVARGSQGGDYFEEWLPTVDIERELSASSGGGGGGSHHGGKKKSQGGKKGHGGRTTTRSNKKERLLPRVEEEGSTDRLRITSKGSVDSKKHSPSRHTQKSVHTIENNKSKDKAEEEESVLERKARRKHRSKAAV